jgi:hypothetical protein
MRSTMNATMIRAAGVVLAIGLTASLLAAQPSPGPIGQRPDPRATVPPPKVEELGHQRYRVGQIVVDKKAEQFTVPGTILRRDPPLEFLAVRKGGYKSYESLIELDASAHEFNVACILIGLDASKAKPARSHFDPQPVEGDPVEIQVGWLVDGKMTWRDAAELLRLGDKTLEPHAWIYTGSIVLPNGAYLAHLDGTVIGFVHDPASIIEHRSGLLGRYRDVAINTDVVPPVGTSITMRVTRPKKKS